MWDKCSQTKEEKKETKERCSGFIMKLSRHWCHLCNKNSWIFNHIFKVSHCNNSRENPTFPVTELYRLRILLLYTVCSILRLPGSIGGSHLATRGFITWRRMLASFWENRGNLEYSFHLRKSKTMIPLVYATKWCRSQKLLATEIPRPSQVL